MIKTDGVTIGIFAEKRLIEYPDSVMRPETDNCQYWDRIRAKLPTAPPKFLPGDLVECCFTRKTVTVQRVEWNNTNPNIPPFWSIDGIKQVNVSAAVNKE